MAWPFSLKTNADPQSRAFDSGDYRWRDEEQLSLLHVDAQMRSATNANLDASFSNISRAFTSSELWGQPRGRSFFGMAAPLTLADRKLPEIAIVLVGA